MSEAAELLDLLDLQLVAELMMRCLFLEIVLSLISELLLILGLLLILAADFVSEKSSDSAAEKHPELCQKGICCFVLVLFLILI